MLSPPGHAEFVDWYAAADKWSEDHGYDDPALSSAHLRAWFEDIIRIFSADERAACNGAAPEDEASSTDYAIGADFIYASFAWSKAEAAYMTVARLAEKHQLGLFNASSSGEEVWLPEERTNDAGARQGPDEASWGGSRTCSISSK